MFDTEKEKERKREGERKKENKTQRNIPHFHLIIANFLEKCAMNKSNFVKTSSTRRKREGRYTLEKFKDGKYSKYKNSLREEQ